MLPSTFLYLLTCLAFSVCVFATPTVAGQNLRFNPQATEIQGRHNKPQRLSLSQLEASKLTNAKRLAMGYPLKPPRRKSPTSSRNHATNVTVTGHLVVFEDHRTLGYVSKRYNDVGEYGILTDEPNEYLHVSLNVFDAALGGTDISTINGPLAAYPYFGGIGGFASESNDLGPDDYGYAVLGGTVQRPSYTGPTSGGNSFAHYTGVPRSIESAIFSYDGSTHEIKCQWVNEDGATPRTYLGYHSQEASLFVTGDKQLFSDKFGSSSIHWVTLTLVPKL
ncbi:hypothetical protein AX17_003894 [Amanita inopinata Kibby_2008]|nr:hypothetical protein AX17_003894 [Amanita inopinata Kibby_2008]